MGFNISGLVIDKNYRDNFEQLEEELGWKLEKESDITFETASSNYTDDEHCDVYFTEKGTILFISMDRCTEAYTVKNANAMTFALSETVMAFNIHYCERKTLVRSIMEIEGDRIEDFGESMIVEDESEDVSDLIFGQIDSMLGINFGAIELEEKAERYIFVKQKKETNKPTYEVKTRILPHKEETEEKSWWQFWK